MKNKGLLLILFFSVLLLIILIYTNYFNNEIYFKNVNSYDKVEVFSNYKNNDNVIACYGNKIKCNKIEYKVQGMVNTKKLGVYTLTYRVKKDKSVATFKKKVEVVDTKSPKLTINGTFENVCPNGNVSGVTFEAIDNYDGNITDKIKYKIKDNRIIYKVTDSSGNSTKKEFDVTINDNEKPTLILNGESTIYISIGSNYIEPGYVAIDNCDGNITEQVNVTTNLDTNKKGTYEITYSIKDEFGNEVVAKRIVKVFPKNNYKPGEVSAKTIYLTFDDGPGAHTERLLDILRKYDVKATFFVTGYNNNYNELLTKEHNEGHTVGLHSYTHNYGLIYSGIDSYMEDLLKIQDKVKQYTGEESKIIRFPGGSSNTISKRYRIGIMSDLTKKVEEIGFRYFDWTIASGDAGNTKDSNKIVQNVISGLKENDVNVVLMHDIKSYTVDAVERIIEYGLANGYTFVPLTMESPIVHQKVNN